jgi:hypothetical protein
MDGVKKNGVIEGKPSLKVAEDKKKAGDKKKKKSKKGSLA